MFFHFLANEEQYAHYKHVNGSTCSSSKFVVKILRQTIAISWLTFLL